MPARVTSGAERWAVELGYKPFPKQNQFHGSPAKYRLFGGAAGPGKSKALLFEAVLQAHEHPGSNVLVLRRTFPELEQSLLQYFRKDVPRELYKSFNESKHAVAMASGSTLRFGYCQRESDVYQYQGAEFLFIGIDELTLFTLRQWQFLTSRNRCPIPGTFPCMAGATNPGNIGHAWVKSLWIDKKPASGMDHPDQYDPGDYEFIPARVTDNPIYASDKSYLKTLRALPSHLRRAFLDGDWEVFAGQYFDRFDPGQSAFRPEEVEWKPWWPRWISVDWGFEHPAAVYWHASIPAGSTPARVRNDSNEVGSSGLRNFSEGVAGRDSGRGSQDRERRTVTYREFVTRRTPPRDLAREIVARSLATTGESGGQEKIDVIYLSPDAFARRTDEASIAEQMGDIFADAGFPRPVPADDDRVSGWMLMYQMLDAGEWLITENCIELIRTLPTLVRDPARIEDIQKMEGDDPADAARYGLKSRHAVGGGHAQPPIEQRLAERVTSDDPTIRAIQAKKAQFDESRRAQPLFVRRRPRR
jgi:phage terminase large subunit